MHLSLHRVDHRANGVHIFTTHEKKHGKYIVGDSKNIIRICRIVFHACGNHLAPRRHHSFFANKDRIPCCRHRMAENRAQALGMAGCKSMKYMCSAALRRYRDLKNSSIGKLLCTKCCDLRLYTFGLIVHDAVGFPFLPIDRFDSIKISSMKIFALC